MSTACQAQPVGEPPIVNVDNVSFRYQDSTAGITDVTIQASRGERILLLGKNGSGKSTLLSLIAGKHAASAGKVSVLGRDGFNDTTLNWHVALIGTPWPPEAYFNCSVKRVASPAPDEARRAKIAGALHLPLSADIDKMSAGEKRRVQVLHGMLRENDVLLLDECSTEIDLAERRTVLSLVAEECEGPKRACCIYATHILDGIEDWATRVIVMEDGKVVRDEPYDAALRADKLLAHRWLAKEPFVPFEPVSKYPFAAGDALKEDEVAIRVNNLSFKRGERYILKDCSFVIPKGARALLVGCNGTGKTTLLQMLAGRTFFANKNSELTIHGYRCFHDIPQLNRLVSFGGDWWTRLPGGEMHVGELIASPLTEHAENVRAALRVDLRWDVRYVSAGERKRIQLLLALEAPSQVVLLDEATADLDLDMRHVLLHLLTKYSREHNVTVLYTTHIFEGLENWATDCVILDRNKLGVHEHIRGGVDTRSIMDTLIDLKSKETWFSPE
uniref:ABC transporter domain-containing protein n=1 Tax=Neobodo designis TaxID=312471 RepID=A0A7S1PN54_NEODS|mmetsp:Transcript_14466/g.44880  ORF Transcript_14466/g.44880 Transcript_14466/m.44880 type:complete len:501 (+) Transcript_14466:44-1546(+)